MEGPHKPRKQHYREASSVFTLPLASILTLKAMIFTVNKCSLFPGYSREATVVFGKCCFSGLPATNHDERMKVEGEAADQREEVLFVVQSMNDRESEVHLRNGEAFLKVKCYKHVYDFAFLLHCPPGC